MDFFIKQFSYRYRFSVVIIDANLYVHNHGKYKFDPPFLTFQAKIILIVKSKLCPLTEFSCASDKIDFDGKTLLPEGENNEYVYSSGLEIFQFRTDDKSMDYITLMDNNMIPYPFAVGEKYTYFLSSDYKLIENDKIEKITLLNATNDNLHPFFYHLGKCGVDSFKTLELSQIHTFYPREEDEENEDDDLVEEVERDEDLIETNCTNGNNEEVKIINQKCVICYERDSVYTSTKCGHQCICGGGYQNLGDIDILKCVVCRT